MRASLLWSDYSIAFFRNITQLHKDLLYYMDIKEMVLGGVGYTVAHLIEALGYKPEGRGFDSRWCHWNFSLT